MSRLRSTTCTRNYSSKGKKCGGKERDSFTDRITREYSDNLIKLKGNKFNLDLLGVHYDPTLD